MHALVLAVAISAPGVDFGWQKGPDGDAELVVQIEPAALEALKSGHEITNQIPRDLADIRRFRIRVGSGSVPRDESLIRQQPAAKTADDAPPESEPPKEELGDAAPVILPPTDSDPPSRFQREPPASDSTRRGSDSSPDATSPAEPRAVEPRPVEPRPAEPKVSEPRDLEPRASEPEASGDELNPLRRRSAEDEPTGPRYAPPSRYSIPPLKADEPSGATPRRSAPKDDAPDGSKEPPLRYSGPTSPGYFGDGPSSRGAGDETDADDPARFRPPGDQQPLVRRTASLEDAGRKPAAKPTQPAGSQQTSESGPIHRTADMTPSPSDTAGKDPPKPWLPLVMVTLALFASLGGNAYLGYIYVGARRQLLRMAGRFDDDDRRPRERSSRYDDDEPRRSRL